MTQQESLQTIVFADVSGSSALYKRVGNEQAKAIVDNVLNFMAALTIVHNGVVVKTIGDEIMARFEHSEEACETAIAIQQRCLKEFHLHGIGVRIGIASGPAILKRNDVFGDTVNDAACVAHIARAGQIVITQSVVNNLSQALLHHCQMFDRINTKGDTDKTIIYRLLWEPSQQDYRATRLMPIENITQFMEKFQLKLQLGQTEIILLPEQMPFRIGRDLDKVNLQINQELVSRDHCHIDFRRGKYVLVDHSTNGTYVYGADDSMIYLRREELPLQGSGAIGVGQPMAQAGPWLISYQL